MNADDFKMLNPNTGTATVLRTRRDSGLARTIYSRVPLLADRFGKEPVITWPAKCECMFHMANDSGLIRTREELIDDEGAWPVAGNIWESETGT